MMDTILAAFLAAALGAGDAREPAANSAEKCEYVVSNADRQVLIVCEDRADDDARHPSSPQDPLIEYGSGASFQTDVPHEDAAGQ